MGNQSRRKSDRERARKRQPEVSGRGELQMAEPNRLLMPSSASIMRLQRTIGNAAQRLPAVQRHPATPPKAETPQATHPAIQRWGESEHKEMGDVGSGGRHYNFREDGSISEVKAGPAPKAGSAGALPPTPFHLTHGDLNMLADYFELSDTKVFKDKDGKEFTDALFVLAQRPSDIPGQKLGTSDEIIYAIYKNNPRDPRFDKTRSGPWSHINKFSDEVMDRVKARYLRLASQNKSHFPTPQDPGPTGRSYTELHEDALWRAFVAGQEGRDIGEGMAREAAAQHFLTDYFSAGHIRTPMTSIRDHWQKKYPLFFDNLKKKIALDVARYMNDNETGIATIGGTVNAIYDVVIGMVEKETGDMPPFTFGDVVGRVGHDVDNEQGVWVVNDLGDRWLTYGDGSLHKAPPGMKENRTLELAALAVRLGNSDIERAFQIGTTSPGKLSRKNLFAHIKADAAGPASPGVKYAPEQVVPRIDQSLGAGKQNWQVESVEKLWNLQVRSDMSMTWAESITDNLKNGEIGRELNNLAIKFPPTKPKKGQTLHPQDAYLNGFVKPLKEKPYESLLGIIHFDPSTSQVWFNEDDMVMEELTGENTDRKGMTDKQLEGMTLQQRAKRIQALVGGRGSVHADEGEQVIRLFKTARPTDRAEIYRLVEGHPWKGDWKQGWFVDDDEIYNGLNDGQLDRLRGIINAK